MKKTVVVNDKMQKNFRYDISEPMGRNFAEEFQPELTPKEMLALGIFGGKYMTDCRKEFPAAWFKNAKLCSEKHDPKLNYFGVNASQPLWVWRKKVGSTMMTPAGGFNGTAGIIWAGVFQMRINVR